MRHRVPVDRKPGTGDVRGACDAEPAAEGELAEALLPAARFRHGVDAATESHRADAKPVRGDAFGRLQDAPPHLRRVELEIFRDPVELAFHGEARLRSAVAALGAARRLVREDARAAEAVRGHFVSDGLQRAGVVRTGDAVRTVRAAIEERLEIHRDDAAIALHACADPHEHGVTSAVAVEHLFAGERDLHRAFRLPRQRRYHDLVSERVGLAAEAAAVGRGDHADIRRIHLEDFRQCTVQVMRRLRAGPHRDLSIGGPLRQRRVLLHGKVSVPFVEEDVLAHVLRRRHRVIHAAEVERDDLVDVAIVGVVVELRLAIRECILDRSDGWKLLVTNFDRGARVGGGVFIYGGHRRNRITHEAHVLGSECVLVLRDGEDPEWNREILSGEHRDHAGERLRTARIDREDPRVRKTRAKQLAVQHAWQRQVVREAKLAGDLGGGVDLPTWSPDYSHRSRISFAASSTASKIFR